MSKLTKEKAIYLQLAELIEEKIFKKQYRPGQMIPSERELCDVYGISRMTVRKAIDSLVDKEILTRVQGKGTFVNRTDMNSAMDGLESMRAFIRESGLLPSNKVIHTAVRPAGVKYAKIFGIDEDSLIFELFRLRLASGKPVAMEYTRAPYDLIENIDKYDFENGSLYELFEKSGFHLGRDKQTLEIVRVTAPQSNLLDVEDNAAVFMLHNTVTETGGRVIEHTRSYIAQRAMTFSTTLT